MFSLLLLCKCCGILLHLPSCLIFFSEVNYLFSSLAFVTSSWVLSDLQLLHMVVSLKSLVSFLSFFFFKPKDISLGPSVALHWSAVALRLVHFRGPITWLLSFLDQHSPVELSVAIEHFYLMHYPLTTCGYWAFEMELVWLRNYILTLFNSNINSHMCSQCTLYSGNTKMILYLRGMVSYWLYGNGWDLIYWM